MTNNNVPMAITAAQRMEALTHPDSPDCTVLRKVLLRTSNEMMGGLDVLESEDEPDYEYQSIGMGKILLTSRFTGSDIFDQGDGFVPDEPMQEALIFSVDVLGFEPQKNDLVGAMLGGGVIIGFEIVGITGNASIYPYTPKWVIAPRNELHSLEPWAESST